MAKQRAATVKEVTFRLMTDATCKEVREWIREVLGWELDQADSPDATIHRQPKVMDAGKR